MKGPVRLWLLLGVSLLFVAGSALILWVDRDPGALMPMLFFGACAGVFWMQLREEPKRARVRWTDLEGDSIRLYREAGAMRVYALLSVVMGIGCGALVFMDTGLFEKAIGLVGLVLFGGGGLVMARRTGGSGMALRVDARGIAFDDRLEPQLAWEDFAGVGLFTTYGQPFLGFYAREGVDPRAGDGIPSRLGGWINARLGYPEFSLGQAGLDMPLEAVGEAVMRLWRQYA